MLEDDPFERCKRTLQEEDACRQDELLTSGFLKREFLFVQGGLVEYLTNLLKDKYHEIDRDRMHILLLDIIAPKFRQWFEEKVEARMTVGQFLTFYGNPHGLRILLSELMDGTEIDENELPDFLPQWLQVLEITDKVSRALRRTIKEQI
ncbi:hypothetical protein ACFL2V_15605 [Pseudomonadota bacterium]